MTILRTLDRWVARGIGYTTDWLDWLIYHHIYRFAAQLDQELGDRGVQETLSHIEQNTRYAVIESMAALMRRHISSGVTDSRAFFEAINEHAMSQPTVPRPVGERNQLAWDELRDHLRSMRSWYYPLWCRLLLTAMVVVPGFFLVRLLFGVIA